MIGGGPAGATAAADLARAGREVRLFHVDPPHGDKPCGGGVTQRCFEERPELASLGVARTDVRRIRLRSPSGREALVETDGAPMFSLFRRGDLDAALRRAAEAAGARIVPERVESVRLESGGAVVSTASGEKRFDAVVGADGAFSRVRRCVGPAAPRAAFCPAVDEVVAGVDAAAGVTLAFFRDVTGYLWVFPRSDGAGSAGLVAREGELRGDRMRERVHEFLRRECPSARVVRSVGWVIPLPDAERGVPGPIAGPRYALVGDAAGVADPITGEGISYAIRTGELAARALAAGDLADYPRLVERELLDDLSFAARWSKRYLRSRAVEAVIAVARWHRGVRSVLRDLMSGRQRYGTLDERLSIELGLLGWCLRKVAR